VKTDQGSKEKPEVLYAAVAGAIIEAGKHPIIKFEGLGRAAQGLSQTCLQGD
jgi:hypothetical protein